MQKNLNTLSYLRFTKMKYYLYLNMFFYALSANATALPSQCSPEEITVFTCSSGKKSMSICASRDDSVEYVEYRHAVIGKHPSFIYRADRDHPKNIFNRASVVGASSESIMIWFENAGNTYIVNDPIKGLPSVSVRNFDRKIAENRCTGNYGGDSEILSQFIREKSSEDYFNILPAKNN